ncbi:Zinc finger protein [Fasciola hepatica]|uniref:Zinc finger protein n=1 Tax=Fasciola hepatica TaxID=6192 RepID=A0A4E0R9L1_FASHE|nr:Zinc finger protein [Fasciola hepatica]
MILDHPRAESPQLSSVTVNSSHTVSPISPSESSRKHLSLIATPDSFSKPIESTAVLKLTDDELVLKPSEIEKPLLNITIPEVKPHTRTNSRTTRLLDSAFDRTRNDLEGGESASPSSLNQIQSDFKRRRCRRKVPVSHARDETKITGKKSRSSRPSDSAVGGTRKDINADEPDAPSSPNRVRLDFERRRYRRKVPIPSARDETTISELLPFKCDICGKRLERAQTLVSHKRAVHEGYRPFSCDLCHAKFTQKVHLKAHVDAVHSGLRPYGCKQCLRRFPTLSGAKMHRCEKRKSRPKYGCGLCAGRFREGVDLREHRLTVHAGEKSFDCTVCGTPFRTESELNDHRTRTHERRKPHACDLCGKSFTHIGALVKHKSAVHEGKRPFECDTCGSAFSISAFEAAQEYCS